MKKYLTITMMSIVFLIACKKEQIKVDNQPNEHKEQVLEISDMSIYNLPSTWTNQKGENLELVDLQENVLVMVMIYTSCKAACPRLVADMRHIEQQVKSKNKDKTKYVLVSIDPETDTPERLKAFAKENQMDGDQWVFLRSTEENTREFAATLAVNYKRISPIDFSHSNIISVFNTAGELTYQQEGLGIDYAPTITEIEKQLNNIK